MSELDNTTLQRDTQSEVLDMVKRLAPHVNDVHRARQLAEAYALATGSITSIHNSTVTSS